VSDSLVPDIEDARYWPDYYARNSAWTLPGEHSYNTQLTPAQEREFRSWVSSNKVPFDPNLAVSDYDMRGFWQAKQQGDPLAKSSVDPNDRQIHFPDRWKTPYAATFSNESQWADPKLAPRWQGDQYVLPNGTVLWDDAKQEASPELWGVTSKPRSDEVLPSARFGLKLGEATEGVVGNALNGLWDFVKAPVAGSEQAAANQLSRPFSEKLAQAMNIALSFGPQTFTGYHGTPHLFDKFADEAIGTGEGSQAFGYGHYVAENPKVAESYREPSTAYDAVDSLERKHPELYSRALDELGEDPWIRSNAMNKFMDVWDHHNKIANIPSPFSAGLTRELIDTGLFDKSQGHLLEINVKPDEHELLDWDKPASEWKQGVLEKIQDLAVQHGMKMGNVTGERFYNEFMQKFAHIPGVEMAESASKTLHEAGIPGIKYLDRGSRAAGAGTHNYVIFDPSNLEIRSRNGVPLVPVDHDPFQVWSTEKGAPELRAAYDRMVAHFHSGGPQPPLSDVILAKIHELDAKAAQDQDYRGIFSTSAKYPLKRGETWRGKAATWAQDQKAKEDAPRLEPVEHDPFSGGSP
jgi:hypothetical protein